jgi:hypothetical protein
MNKTGKWILGIVAFLFILCIISVAVSNTGNNSTAPTQTPQTPAQATPATTAPAAQMSESDFLNDLQGWTGTMSTVDTDAGTQTEGMSDGTIDQATGVAALTNDKQQIDGVISDMQGVTPPTKYQNIYNLILEANQDTSQGLQDGINGINNNDPNEINQGTNLFNDATDKLNQATTEESNMGT